MPLTRPPRRHALTILGGLLLLTAIALIFYGSRRTALATFHERLANVLPPAPPGWTRIERPIADTPEMKAAVKEALNYDDGVFFDYDSGALRLSVYVAYWTPGKMSSRSIAFHTPDICWVQGGWERTSRNVSDRTVVDGELLKMVETRTFVANGTAEYVWFWHLVGGRSQSYMTGTKPPWYAMFTDLFRSGFNQRAEQFFIRLSSPQHLDDPALSPVLAPVLKALPVGQSPAS